MITPRQHERIIQIGLLLLVALMPFHAFVSVWLGSITGQQAVIQAWKELLLLSLVAGSSLLILREPKRLQRLKTSWIIAAGLFTMVAIIITIFAVAKGSITTTQAAIGAKTDIAFLVAATIAALVSGPWLNRNLIQLAVGGGIIVAAFVTLQAYVLPSDFLVQFGYGGETILPYLHLNSTSNLLRFSGTLGGPNQLGGYLLVPLGLILALGSRRQTRWLWAVTPVVVLALWNSYSRSAWLGAAVMVAILAISLAPQLHRRATALGLVAATLGSLLLVSSLLTTYPTLQERVLHATLENHNLAGSSDRERLNSLSRGVTATLANPLGLGLGSAGPATFYTAQPNIIENQFVQYAHEAGWAGLGLMITVIGLLVRKLRQSTNQPAGLAAAAALIGISCAGLVIPAWDDSSTALVAFTLAGALAGEQHV